MASTGFDRIQPPHFRTSATLLAARVFKGRWFMLYACFLIMSSSGAAYIFGIYSEDIKSSLNYNQQTLNTLSFFKDLGANVGILSGLINEVSPPFVVLLIGAIMNLFGYLMIYLSITARLSRPHVWQMCLYIFVGANSQSFANTGALVTAVKNFPESRGMVLGLIKCYVGLSGAIFTQLYLAFYGADDSKSLVLLVAWLPAAVSFVFVYTVRIMEPLGRGVVVTTKPFYYFLYFTVALGGYLLVIIVVEKIVSFSRAELVANGAAVIFLLFIPVAVVVREEVNSLKQSKAVTEQQSTSNTVPGQEDDNQSKTITEQQNFNGASSGEEEIRTSEQTTTTTEQKRTSCIADIFRPPARGEDYSILQALFSIDMLIIFFSTICGVGGTLTAIDNMGQIGESLGYPSRSINTFVSLISIWNAMGRVAAGFISEIFLTRYKVPRPLLLTVVLFSSCAGHLLITFGVSNSLYVASTIIGFCYGAQWSLIFAIISEIFGLKYYSTLYNLGGVASPIGSYILNVRVAGNLYDREWERQNGGGGGGGGKEVACDGVKCFQLSFLIITAATMVGALVSLVLVVRSWKFYKGDIYARFREPGADDAMERGSSADKEDKRKLDGREVLSEVEFTVR